MLRAKRSHEDDNNMCSSPSIQALSGNEDFRKIIDVIPSNNCETACSSSAEKVTDRDSNKYCSGNETFTSLKQKRKRILININEESPNFENAMKIKRKPCSSPPFELVSLHKENRFGIEEYMLENYQGFSGIIKDSYSDFIVQEIDTDNQVVEMNDSSIPAYFSLESEEKEKTFLSLNSISDFIQELSNLLNCYEDSENEFLNQVSSYLTLNLGNSPPKETKTITSNNIYPCKEHRTKIHSFLKSYSLLNSDTFEQHIRIHVGKQKKLNQRSNSLNWPSAFRERGDYVLFHLYKENMDTLEAIRYLSHFLHVPESHFAFAGTKDKRAITIQRCTVFRIHPKRLISFKHPRMKCGHFQLIKEPLKLGALNGNQFRIRLRNVQMTYTSLQLDSFLGDLKEVGIINYFGMQRFGTGSISSHQIGLALLQQNFEKAMDFIMAPRLGDSPQCTSARLYFAEKKEKTPLEMFPKHALAERAILRALPCTPENAIKAIPIKLRTMYVHAYQSYIWNKVVSSRIRMGKIPLIGDIIGEGTEVTKLEQLNNLSLKDIMIPLPGHSVVYPSNTKNEYKRLLETDGLTLETFQAMKDWLLRLPGGYRPLVIHPQNLKSTWISPESNEENKSAEKLLELQFQLPSSSYATMVLRELLRSETSSSAQSLQSISFLQSSLEQTT